jgi:hypothetical protein
MDKQARLVRALDSADLVPTTTPTPLQPSVAAPTRILAEVFSEVVPIPTRRLHLAKALVEHLVAPITLPVVVFSVRTSQQLAACLVLRLQLPQLARLVASLGVARPILEQLAALAAEVVALALLLLEEVVFLATIRPKQSLPAVSLEAPRPLQHPSVEAQPTPAMPLVEVTRVEDSLVVQLKTTLLHLPLVPLLLQPTLVAVSLVVVALDKTTRLRHKLSQPRAVCLEVVALVKTASRTSRSLEDSLEAAPAHPLPVEVYSVANRTTPLSSLVDSLEAQQPTTTLVVACSDKSLLQLLEVACLVAALPTLELLVVVSLAVSAPKTTSSKTLVVACLVDRITSKSPVVSLAVRLSSRIVAVASLAVA